MRTRETVLLVIVLAGAGCTTTPESRRLAADLGDQVDGYMNDRRASIEALNADYRATYATLIGDHRELSTDRLRLERGADARAMADAVLLDWARGTTFTAIAEELERLRTRQFAAMERQAEAIAGARRQYAESYNDLELELEKLENAQRQLADLSQPEDSRRATLELLRRLGETYQKVRAERATADPSSGS